MTDDIAPRLRPIVAQALDLPPDDVGPGLDLTTAPAWSSLQHMMLVSELESRFGVRFSRETVAGLTTWERIVEALERAA